MQRIFLWHCSKCSFHFEAYGPKECTINNDSKKPKIQELRSNKSDRSDGLFVHGFCKTCKKEVDVIILELKKPGNPWNIKKDDIKSEYLENYNEHFLTNHNQDTISADEYSTNSLKCPICDTNILFYPDISEYHLCPICRKGQLEMVGELIK